MVKHRTAFTGSVLALALGSGVLAPAVWADGEYDLAGCAAGTEAKVCTLTSDVVLDSMITLTSDLTVDLNGHNITSASNAKFFEVRGHGLEIVGTGELSSGSTANAGMVRVYGTETAGESAARTNVSVGENVTISGPNPVVIYNYSGTNKTAYNVTVDIYGKLHGHNSGVWMIGTVGDKTNYPVINIHDGAELTADAEIVDINNAGGVAASAMGYAEWNIGEATLTGVGSGVGIKGGIVNIDGATVTGTGDPTQLPPELYNNGIRPSGAAVQIEKNSGYPGDIELSIVAGEFTSVYNDTTIYEYGPAEAIKSVQVSGGVFNKPFDTGYLAEGYSAYEKPQDVWTVDEATTVELPERIVIKKGNSYTLELGEIAAKYVVTGMMANEFVSLDGLTISGNAAGEALLNVALHEMGRGFDVTIPVDVYDLDDEDADVYVEIAPDGVDADYIEEQYPGSVAAFATAANGKTKAGYYEIVAMLHTGDGVIPMADLGGLATVTFDLPEGLPAVADGFTRYFYMLRYHDGETVAIDVKNNGDGTGSFENDLFSAFALVYEDVEEEAADEGAASGESDSTTTPETGTVTAAGASASAAALMTAVAVGVITTITSFVYLIRRK